jgi:hypothetical protein
MDTSELAELEDVENQGEELSESLGMSDGAGIKGKEPASARLQNQRTPVATVDGADATATPRAGSPGPRVRMQGGLLLPMNVEIDDDRVMDDAEAVEVDQDDLDHIEVLDDVSAMPDRVSVEEDMPSVEMALSLMTVITVRTEVLCGDNSGRQTGEQERGSNLQAVQQTWSHCCRLFAYCGTFSSEFSMSRQSFISLFSCPTSQCQYCGELDQHDSRQCPEQMLCFNCGERGHFSQVS